MDLALSDEVVGDLEDDGGDVAAVEEVLVLLEGVAVVAVVLEEGGEVGVERVGVSGEELGSDADQARMPEAEARVPVSPSMRSSPELPRRASSPVARRT